ncbi:MAG TPA: ABC transporter permease, partial [Flavisolibacter sp.]|nr:ABC transporter permease [Flavisolibacter sp.]
IIQYETSYDNFHPKKEHIYRVCTQFYNEDGITFSGGIALPVAEGLKIDFPEIKEVASIFRSGDGQVTIEDKVTKDVKKLYESSFYFAQPEFFKMFSFGWLAGNPDASLKNPNSVVLSKSIAEKYFGSWKNAVGKSITHDNKYTYIVTGILKDVPDNTDFPLKIVISYSTLNNTGFKRNLKDWVSTFSDNNCYIVLPDNYPVKKMKAQLVQFAKRHKPAEYSRDAYVLQPLSDIHYNPKLGNFKDHTFSHSLITALIIIGIFLVLIACVNYINLSTAQALVRTREVGIRKVLGSYRQQLTFQFLIETAIISLIALTIANVIAIIVLPFLNNFLDTKIHLNLLSNPQMNLFLLAVFILVTLFSGLYPALVLSGFSPITALKSKVTNQKIGGVSLRRVLVVVQFAIAHILIIGMLIVISQMNFIQNASLGFDKEQIINVAIPSDSVEHTKIDYLRNQLLQNTDIKNVSFSYSSPSADGNWQSDFKFDNSTKNTDFSSNLKWADPDYFKTYNLQFVAGRSYYPSDTV